LWEIAARWPSIDAKMTETISRTAGISVVRAIWGVAATDIIAPGDYDGDGKTEYSVWRPGTPGVFYMLTAGTGRFTTTAWGAAGDIPVASYNVR